MVQKTNASRPQRLPPLNALRALEAIQQTGSVTAAARRLSVSHSAVSHQMKILEAWTSRPLFARRGRSTVLTPEGASLAAVAHEAFDAIRHEMDRLPMRATRTIALAALPIVATEWLVPRLEDFARAHPRVSLHLSLAQTDRPVLPAPELEILFARRSQVQAGDEVLWPGDAVPVCAPGLLAAWSGDAARLIAAGPLIYDEDLRMWPLWHERARLPARADPDAAPVIVEGSALLRAVALAGRGVAICRAAFLAADLAAGRLVCLSPVSIDEDWCYFLRTAPGAQADADVAAVRAWLRAAAAGTGGG
jgi:LysR family glycine cleavage system transcriptional activator